MALGGAENESTSMGTMGTWPWDNGMASGHAGPRAEPRLMAMGMAMGHAHGIAFGPGPGRAAGGGRRAGGDLHHRPWDVEPLMYYRNCGTNLSREGNRIDGLKIKTNVVF